MPKNARMLEQVTGTSHNKTTGMDSLTDHELDILRLTAKALSTKNIAAS